MGRGFLYMACSLRLYLKQTQHIYIYIYDDSNNYNVIESSMYVNVLDTTTITDITERESVK